MAIHLEEHHHTFENLINALESDITKTWDTIEIGIKEKEERINLSIFCPLIILQGDIYSCNLIKDKISLSKENHIQFRKSLYNQELKQNIYYQIDVITESYLTKFLKIFDIEMKKTEKILKDDLTKIKNSISKIIDTINKKNRDQSIRNLMESF